jgi:hypothetical protein
MLNFGKQPTFNENYSQFKKIKLAEVSISKQNFNFLNQSRL